MSEALSERAMALAGPLVVKEVRQALRTRTFGLLFGVLLTACFFLAVFAWAVGSERDRLGPTIFALYLGVLGTMCFFVIPFTAFRSLVRELEDETWGVLTLTGLSSADIVRGKWLSAMSQAALYASVCAPFMLFSYFLNGVDVIQSVMALCLVSGWTAILTAVALGIGTLPHGRLMRTVVHFVVLAVLGGGTLVGAIVGLILAKDSQRLLVDLVAVLGRVIFSWALTWLLLRVSAAGVALPEEAASRRARSALGAVTVLALVFKVVMFVTAHGTGRDAEVGQALMCLFLTLAGVVAVSERDGWSSRLPASMRFKPGALRSALLVVLLLALSTATWLVLGVSGAGSVTPRAVLAIPLYPLLYLSLAVVLGRLTPLRSLGEGPASMVAFVVVVVLGVLGSLFVASAAGRLDHRIYNAFNPILGVVNFIERGSNSDMEWVFGVLCAVTFGAVLLAGLTLRARDGARS